MRTMLNFVRAWTWVVLLLLGASACKLGGGQIGEKPSVGEEGKASFKWQEGAFGCLFGCNADEAVALGAVAQLSVDNYKVLPAFTVRSENAAIAEFHHTTGGSISVVGRGVHDRYLLSPVNAHKLRKILARMLDESEFLGDYGIRDTHTYLRGDINALDYRRLHRHLATHTYFAEWIAFRRSERGRLLRHYTRASEGFFQFFFLADSAALAVVSAVL